MHARADGEGESALTLLELACVVMLIALMTALAVPSFATHIRRAQVAEARFNVEHLAYLERAYRLAHGAYLACASSPAAVPRGRREPWTGNADFRALGFAAPNPGFYQYAVELSGDGFRAVARGDLDNDGVQSMLAIDAAGIVSFANELE